MTTQNLFLQENTLYKKRVMLWLLFALSILSLFTTITLPYQGEEAVYTLTSLEMWYYNEWFAPLAYGNDYGRPPLFNWAIIPLATLLDWKQVLVASRLVTVLSTIGSACILGGLTQRLFQNKTLSLFTLCIFLSGDLLFRRGWLAYADPLFSFFVFLAIASLWLCLESKRKTWLGLAVVGLIASYLTKALTGYAFYAGALLVLLCRHPNRRVLWTPGSIALHSFALGFILLWDYCFSHSSHSAVMISDILTKFNLENAVAYLVKLMTFPLDTLYRFLPCSGLLLYFVLKDRVTQKPSLQLFKNDTLKTLLWIVLINYIPYWIAPFVRIRYLLPLYPFISILIAYGLTELGKQDKTRMNLSLLALWLCLLLKYSVSVGIPYYEKQYKRDFKATAEDIIKRVGKYPLYTNNMAATGLSVTAHLDILRLPKAPLEVSPKKWKNAFVLTYSPDFPNTKVVKIYPFDKSSVYLLCRGKACRK